MKSTVSKILPFLIFIAPLFFYFGMLYSTVSILFTAFILWKYNPNTKFFTRHNLPLIFLISYFLFSAVSFFWSEDKASWQFDTQVKLSLLFIPLLYLFGNTKSKEFLRFLKAFFLASVTISLLHLMVMLYNFAGKHYTYYMLIGGHFTLFMHPSYYGLYLDFAIVSGFYLITRSYINKKFFYAGLLLITLNIFFGMSKISFIVTVVIFAVILLTRIKGKLLIPGTIAIIALIITGYKLSPKMREMTTNITRYKEVLNHPDKDYPSTAVRILTWNATSQILNHSNIIIGNGSGDTKKILMKFYKQHNYKTPYQKALNSHNQFLETLNATGIIGLLLFSAAILISLIISIKEKNYLLAWLNFIIIANFAVESMLNRQNGVLFFALFFTILNKLDYE